MRRLWPGLPLILVLESLRAAPQPGSWRVCRMNSGAAGGTRRGRC